MGWCKPGQARFISRLWRGLLLLPINLLFAGHVCAQENATASSEGELDLKTYQQELGRVSTALEEQLDLRQLRESLPSIWRVRSRETVFEIPTKEISDGLLAVEKDGKKQNLLAEVKQRLVLLQREAAQLEARSASYSDAESEAKLREILSRKEFHDSAAPSAFDLLRAKVSRWIFERIVRLLSRLHISETTGNYFSWGLIFLAAVVLFYVVYRKLIAGARNDLGFKAEVPFETAGFHELLREALNAANRGDFRNAIHLAYWTAVSRLEETRLLPRDRARTPRESVRLLDRNPREQGSLKSVTGIFEVIWYGYRPATHTEWAVVKQQLENLGCLQESTAQTAQS
jgi:hypothetical protein